MAQAWPLRRQHSGARGGLGARNAGGPGLPAIPRNIRRSRMASLLKRSLGHIVKAKEREESSAAESLAKKTRLSVVGSTSIAVVIRPPVQLPDMSVNPAELLENVNSLSLDDAHPKFPYS